MVWAVYLFSLHNRRSIDPAFPLRGLFTRFTFDSFIPPAGPSLPARTFRSVNPVCICFHVFFVDLSQDRVVSQFANYNGPQP